MYKIRYDLYREPSVLMQISRWPLFFGIILLALTIFLFYIGNYLPLEFLILYLVEIVAELILHLIALSTIFISVGLFLEHLGWRNGQLTFQEDRIGIEGSKNFYLKYDGILRVKYLKGNKLQIRTRYYPVRIKFDNAEIVEKTVKLIERNSKDIFPLDQRSGSLI